ncbi:MAG: cytochrome c [Alphaproteobacteria bacterium]
MSATDRSRLTRRGARGLLLLLAAAPAAFVAGPALATGDIEAGRQVASVCGVCHGLDGIAKVPDAPNIGGESTFYLERQLELFRSGERTHQQMSIIAQGLSDEDIANVAAYYSAIEIEVVSIPGQ